MMKFNASIRRDPRYKGDLKKIVKGLKSSGVEGGVLTGTGRHPNADGATVAEVAVFNEFGTRRIPSRPFIRATLRMRRRSYRSKIRSLLREIIRRKNTAEGAERELGMILQNDLRATLKHLTRPANAPRTIAKKRSSNPLIDTGYLRQSINWAVLRKRFGLI